MTRGKYAARSAQHRAEAAETTADRYIEEAKKWKAAALRNKAMAELTAGLQKEIRRLHAQPTVALDDHDRIVTALRIERAEYEDRVTAAMIKVVDRLGENIATRLPDHDAAFGVLCVALLEGLQELPEAVADALWDQLEFERELRRSFREPGLAKRFLYDVKKTTIQMGMRAQEAGFGFHQIPADWVRGPKFRGAALEPEGLTSAGSDPGLTPPR